MSTRSLIAKQVEADKYRVIYCHSNGYLTHNGALLLDHYNSPEKVDELLALGDISILGKHVNPDPNKIYASPRKKIEDGLTFAYARDGGERLAPASIYTLKKLLNAEYAPFIYIYTMNHEWKYYANGVGTQHDVKENLDAIYGKYGLKRPEDYYGDINRRVAIQLEEQGKADVIDKVPEDSGQLVDEMAPTM